MNKKAWEIGLGERTGAQPDGDTLLAQSKSERERARIQRQEEIEAAEHETKKAELEKKRSAAEAAVNKSGEKKEESTSFKVSGGLHLGEIDLQEERRKAAEESERLRKEAADNANRTAQENAQLREALHLAEMREMRAEHAAALELIANKIDNRSPMEIMRDIRESAAELGLKAPEPGISDPQLSIQLMQLQHEEAARAREFEWKMKQDDYAREDRKEELRNQREFNTAKLAVDKERAEFFRSLPASIGEAIGKGIAASPENERGGVSSGNKKLRGELTVPVGVGGRTKCPSCETDVGIGSTARKAICANCGTEIIIKREKQPEGPAPISGAEQQTTQPDEEE